ncbi:hypothetical protein MRB53_013870 [Persea americana]|uniref:Uncharacterized protein n=1 Tax=Persea americana TaxID=3435 RepID=A0ACC2K9Q9_PERAE|nr:hypothetical protein MRB53_013870 [Persea americana]
MHAGNAPLSAAPLLHIAWLAGADLHYNAQPTRLLYTAGTSANRVLCTAICWLVLPVHSTHRPVHCCAQLVGPAVMLGTLLLGSI